VTVKGMGDKDAQFEQALAQVGLVGIDDVSTQKVHRR
jgi:hypothetical protein